MILGGWDRRPRRGLPSPEDIAAIWMRLSDRQRARVESDAAGDGVTVEVQIRRRWAACARVLIGPDWPRVLARVNWVAGGSTPLKILSEKAHNGEA